MPSTPIAAMASARENEYDSWGLTHYSGATCFLLDLYSSCVSVFGILKSVQVSTPRVARKVMWYARGRRLDRAQPW